MSHYELPAGRVVGLLAMVLTASLSVAADFSVDYQVLARTGDPSPDGNGVFSNQIGPPLLNDAGDTAFLAKLLATTNATPIDDLGLYRANDQAIQTLVRGGEPSAAGNQIDLLLLTFASTFVSGTGLGLVRSQFALDRFGSLTFVATDDDNEDAIYRTDGAQLEVVIQTGQDTVFGTSVNVAQVVNSFLANDEGQLAHLVSATSDMSNKTFQVLSQGSSNQPLLESGQSLSDGRTLAAYRNSALNNAGQMLMRLNTSQDTFGYYLVDEQGTSKLLHTGEPAPDGQGSFAVNVLSTPNLNDNGQAVLQAFVDDISADYTGVFFHDGTQLTELFRTDDQIVGVPFVNMFGIPKINNNGTLAYTLLSDDRLQRLVLQQASQQTLVLTEGELLPAPIGLSVDTIRGAVLNEQDKLLIGARLRDGGTATEALLLFDPQFGLALVARAGQAFGSGVIVGLAAALPIGIETNANFGNAENSFNNLGRAAFTYLLDNGEAGVALADVTFEREDMLFSDGFESL